MITASCFVVNILIYDDMRCCDTPRVMPRIIVTCLKEELQIQGQNITYVDNPIRKWSREMAVLF